MPQIGGATGFDYNQMRKYLVTAPNGAVPSTPVVFPARDAVSAYVSFHPFLIPILFSGRFEAVWKAAGAE